MMIVILSFYLLVMLGVGYVAGRRVGSLEDYLIAERRLPYWLAVPTIVATWFGAGSCMGVSGTVYREGFYGVLADPFGCSLALLIAGLFYVGAFRRRRLTTISDLLVQAYGRRFETWATVLMLPFYLGTLASQMLAMGYFYQVISGGSATFGILLGSFVVVAYTMAGGMWAVTITDFIQLALLSLAVGLMLFVTLNELPSLELTLVDFQAEWSGLLSPPGQAAGIDWLAYSGRIAMTALGAIMGQDLIQRSLASRSEGVARASTVSAAFVYFALGMVPVFIGIAGRSILPGLENSDLLLPLLAQKFLSPWLFALFASGLLAAIMSTADSYLLAGTSLLTQNIILAYLPPQSERAKLRLVRWISIAMAFLALILAFSGQSIFNLMVHSGAMLFVAIFVPASAALFLTRPKPRAAWAAMGFGILAWLMVVGWYGSKGAINEDALFAAALVGALSSLVVFALGSITLPQKALS